ncbi:testis-specific serine/threonine-protein kinase 4-like [Leptosomus discolor]
MADAPSDPETVLVLGKMAFQLGPQMAHGAYWEVYEAAAPPPLWHKVAIEVTSKRKALEEDVRNLLPRQMQARTELHGACIPAYVPLPGCCCGDPPDCEVLKGLCHEHLITPYQGTKMRAGFYLLMDLPPSGSVLERVSQPKSSSSQRSSQPKSSSSSQRSSRPLIYLQLPPWPLTSASPQLPSAWLPIKAVLSQTFCRFCAYACPKTLQVLPYDPFLTDTWSARVILYALLLGCMPFNATTVRHLLCQIQQHPVLP